MSRPVLIVGGGPAGLSAAQSLASAGQAVVLVDKADSLGGAPIQSGYARLVPSGEWARDAIGGMVDRVKANELVDVRVSTVVNRFEGEAGDFTATLSDGTDVKAGRIETLYDPKRAITSGPGYEKPRVLVTTSPAAGGKE